MFLLGCGMGLALQLEISRQLATSEKEYFFSYAGDCRITHACYMDIIRCAHMALQYTI